MIKGRTKIELFDAGSGRREKVFEDENLVTNAIRYAMNIESAGNQRLDDWIFPLATKALGGLLMFDGTLEEDAENIYLPHDVHIVGYGNTAANTDNIRRGSYNVAESGPTDDGYISVWDFGTSQANGVIRSVARTSVNAGGNPLTPTGSIRLVETKRNGFTDTDTGWVPIRYESDYVFMMKYNSSTHQMRCARLRLPLLTHKVRDCFAFNENAEELTSWDCECYYWQTQSGRYTYDHYRYGDTNAYWDNGDGLLYCIQNAEKDGNSSGNGSFSYFTLNYGNDSWEKSDTHRVEIASASLRSWDRGSVYLGGRYLYWLSYNRKSIYIIDMENPVNVRAVRVIDESSADYIEGFFDMGPRNGGARFYVYHYLTTGYQRFAGLLYPDGVYYYDNVAFDWNSSYNSYLYGLAHKLVAPMYYDSWRVRIAYRLDYLGTINNLATPVEKNASQTMKVSYTLTDV
jgi:hypothetical protein